MEYLKNTANLFNVYMYVFRKIHVLELKQYKNNHWFKLMVKAKHEQFYIHVSLILQDKKKIRTESSALITTIQLYPKFKIKPWCSSKYGYGGGGSYTDGEKKTDVRRKQGGASVDIWPANSLSPLFKQVTQSDNKILKLKEML